MMYIMSLS